MAVNYAKRYQITAEQLAELRDDQHFSWAKLADTLELGSPGTARRVYTELVRPHRESRLPKSARSTAGATPVALTDEHDEDAIRGAVAGHTITVQRSTGTETLHVADITSIGTTKGGKRTVNFKDGDGRNRSVHATAILSIR